MVNQQILSYIRQQLQNNISREVISGLLINQGWKKEDVDEAFSLVSTNNITLNVQATPHVNLMEEISSNKYPLTNRWFYSSMVSSFFGTIISSLFIAFIFLGYFTKNVSKVDPNYFNDSSVVWKIVIIVLCVFIVLISWSVISLLLWKGKYKFEFTSENIYYRTGVLAISEKNMPYNTVQDINVKQGIVDRMFGISKVVIENAAQDTYQVRGRSRQLGAKGISIEGLQIGDANHIADVLRKILLSKNSQNTGL